MPLPVNPFWQFSIERYARPGVAECCLQLQDDFGADVNLVLYALWLAENRRCIDMAAILTSDVPLWSREVVQSSRVARRAVKARLMEDASLQSLYGGLKAQELGAEQWQQKLLYDLYPQMPGAEDGLDKGSLAHANLTNYFEQIGVADKPGCGFGQLLSQLLDLI